MKAKTLEGAFRELAESAYHGALKPDSSQWEDVRKFFYAGAIWFVEQCNTRTKDDVGDLLKEMRRFLDEVSDEADVTELIRRELRKEKGK